MNNEPHSKTLFQLKLFWAAATIPIAAGIFLSLLVSNQANLLLDFTPDGMAYFWENFQLSIWIMGLSIPLVVMVASHHRSVQTAAQIKSQKEQNTFANYFEHRREFKNEVREYFNKYLNQSRGYLPEIFTLNLLHSRVFPNVPEGNYEVDLDFWEEVRHFVVMFYQEGLYKIFFTENSSSIFEITGDNFKRPQMIAHIHFSDVYQNLILTTVQSFSQLTEHSVSEFQFSSPSNNLDFKPIYEFSKSIERFYRLIIKC